MPGLLLLIPETVVPDPMEAVYLGHLATLEESREAPGLTRLAMKQQPLLPVCPRAHTCMYERFFVCERESEREKGDGGWCGGGRGVEAGGREVGRIEPQKVSA